MSAVRQAGLERSDSLSALWPRLPRPTAACPDRSTRARPVESRAGGECDGDSVGRSRALRSPARASEARLAARSASARSDERHRVTSLPYTTPPVRPPSPAGTRRYALTWVNIHGERTQSSPTVGILNPGDPVLADSLVRGWYRVSVEGRILGYVYRS